MSFRLALCLSALMILCLDGTVTEAQDGATSFRFNQPIRVTIRRTNNSVQQAMLVGIDANNVTVMSPQGRPVEYPNNTVRSVRNADGSFFYSPAKDNLAETIQKLNQTVGANGPASQPGGPGQPGATSTVPFTVSGANPQPGAGHAQPGAGHAQPNPGFNNPQAAANAAMAKMMHAQANAANAHSQPSPQTPYTMPQPGAHSQGSHAQPPGMPMPGHSQQPSMPMPGMPMGGHSQMGAHSQMPSMPMQNATPQMMMEYECSKCKHRFQSAVEIKAGHKCARCGVIWGQVQDQNGNVTSRSTAGRIGGGVGVVVAVIGIIAAIVRKSQSA